MDWTFSFAARWSSQNSSSPPRIPLHRFRELVDHNFLLLLVVLA
jgi:hypothetical protein